MVKSSTRNNLLLKDKRSGVVEKVPLSEAKV